MREYETTFIVQPEISDEGCQAICERLDGLLEKHGAMRLLYDDDGKRKLAYEIDDFQKGRYLCLHYFDQGGVVPELEQTLRLDESVLRFLTVRVADQVTNIDERRQAAAVEERERAERAAERAAREAEERAAREEEERLAREAAEARAEAEASEASAEQSEADSGEEEAGDPPAETPEEGDSE